MISLENPEACTGCLRCELACSYHHTRKYSRSHSSIRVDKCISYPSKVSGLTFITRNRAHIHLAIPVKTRKGFRFAFNFAPRKCLKEGNDEKKKLWICWQYLTGRPYYCPPLDRTYVKFAPRFLGGRGINQWILLNELRSWVTPFEPANILCFGAGALTGTLVPGASRLNIDSKNALTLGIGSGNAGGWFASEMKFAGYDHVVVQGKAKWPVYLYIEDDKISFRPARDLWGKDYEGDSSANTARCWA